MSNQQQGDVKLFQTNDDGEIEAIGGIITMDGGMATAAYLAMFGGNDRDSGEDGAKFQYWGNLNEDDVDGHYRSMTQHLLRSIPATVHNLLRIEDAAKSDLAFFLRAGIASEVEVTVTMPALNHVNISGSITADGKREDFNFTENWGASKPADPLPSALEPDPPAPPTPPSIEEYATLGLNGSNKYLAMSDAPFGDVDWWGHLWVKPKTIGVTHMLLTKWDGGAPEPHEFYLAINSSNLFDFTITEPGAEVTNSVFSTVTATLNTWHSVYFGQDKTSGNIFISVDDETKVTETKTINTADGAAVLQFGRINDVGGDLYADVDATTIRCGAGLLSGAEETELYGGGYGLLYSELSAGIQSSAFLSLPLHDGVGSPFDDESGSGYDSTPVNGAAIDGTTKEFTVP